VAIVVFLLIRTGTVYFFNGSGYRAFSKGQMHKHEVSQDKLRLVIERMLPGDRFDMLWVSWKDDEYSGIMLTLLDGPPKLSISFKTKTEQPELKSFKAAMAVLNYPVEEDSDSFNGGFGEENRITSLEYPLSNAPPRDQGSSSIQIRTHSKGFSEFDYWCQSGEWDVLRGTWWNGLPRSGMNVDRLLSLTTFHVPRTTSPIPATPSLRAGTWITQSCAPEGGP